ncbi:UPF0692 protein C19orf54-like [Hondaea fermentalgiana]|uniref:Actin maturation protease n=1 Tax=Hondaea fermentalgiana TaxID=2315210 RepID=A0A2R5GQ67_9STRA|nr:UPF0692 protein C19orf54-like [Hondaea fermentalgiana]|eukprot:GBG31918.1 UPF0692 protein C19orf54-like [Hondaea fermentalgiana]
MASSSSPFTTVLDPSATTGRARRLVDEACALLHAEWPAGGSLARRAQRLREQQEAGSVFLGLVQVHDNSKEDNSADNEHCVGFAQLQAVADKGEGPACALTSVVISETLRGSGLGRQLMNGIHDQAESLGYTYVYLWTSTAQGFYAKCGYLCCESVTVARPILDNLAENQVSALERMLAKMRARNAEQDTGQSSTVPDYDHESADAENVVWMRKRLIEDLPAEILDADAIEAEVCADLRHFAAEATGFHLALLNVPLHRQVGPSCGLAALRMARHYLCGAALAPGAPSLLQEAQQRGYSTDGELYKIDDLASLAQSVSGLSAKVVAISVEALAASISPSHVAILPYDRGAGSAPEERHGKSAHYALVVGSASQDASLAAGEVVREDTSIQECDFIIAQHGMSRRLVVARTSDWIASNNQLDLWPALKGKMLILSSS